MADVSPRRADEGGPSLTVVDRIPPPLAKRPDIRLGATLVRPSRLALEGPSGSVPVERRMMEVLLAFVDAEGAVLTREDLLARCWPGVVVGDDALHRVVGGLRRAGAEAGGGFAIETIPRVGYRLQKQDDPARPLADGAAADVPSPPAHAVPRRWLLAGGVAALSASGLAIWASRPRPDPVVTQQIAEAQAALRLGTSESEGRAIALLARTVAQAPDNADALGLLALARARTDEHAAPDKATSIAEIENPARRALVLDPGNADAKAALAIAIPYYGDWLAAERRFDAVLAEHPDHLVTRGSRAFLLNAVGRVREGSTARLAPSRDAAFDANQQYGEIYALWFLGRIGEGDRVAARGMEMWPGHPGIWFARLWLLAGTGRFNRALAQIDDVAARPPLPPPMFETLRIAMSAAMTRRPGDVGAATARVMASAQRSVSAVVNAMMLLNLLGATDRAFELARAYYLEQGALIVSTRQRPGEPVVNDERRRKTNMLFIPTAAAMRRDPRFLPLMEQMGLVSYWERRGVRPDFMLSGIAGRNAIGD